VAAETSRSAVAAPASPGAFRKYKREIGAVVGLVLCAAVWLMPAQQGLPREGQQCLALSLLAVIWWAFGVMHSGYTSIFVLMGWLLTKTAAPDVIFRMWTTPLIYLVIGGYLIAAAVESSGLGKRIAYLFILRFVNGYNSIIAACYVLGFLLSFMIPHPWPRSFIIMSVMAIIIKAAKLEHRYAANIGLAVFAGSIPTAMILLTGDSTLNVVAMNFAGMDPSWVKWILYMGVPGVVASVITYLLQIRLFKPPAEFVIHKEEIRARLGELGTLSRGEKTVIFWVAVAIAFWATDFLHHLHPGWIALSAAVMLALPRVGDVLKPADFSKVNVGTLMFFVTALGIGTVGGATGMNKWVAAAVLPNHVPENYFVLALLVTAFAVAIHMVLGSVLAVMSIVTPAIVAFTSAGHVNPLVPALLVYTAVNGHYLLPFHNMALLVGVGESGGHYQDPEVLKLGIPLTLAIVFITVCVEIPWWYAIGLIK
jgi:anion transporter